MGREGWEGIRGDLIGIPAQILIVCRADGPHSHLLEFFVEQMGPAQILDKLSSKRFRTHLYIFSYAKQVVIEHGLQRELLRVVWTFQPTYYFIVETESDTVWNTIATLTNCNTLLQLIIFPNSVGTKRLRITVTLTQKASKDLYSRINEIIPVVSNNTSSAITSLETIEPSSTAKPNASSGTITSFDVCQPTLVPGRTLHPAAQH